MISNKIIFLSHVVRSVDIQITVDNFMEVLDNGVDVCRLAEIIHKKAQNAASKGEYEGVRYFMLLLLGKEL